MVGTDGAQSQRSRAPDRGCRSELRANDGQIRAASYECSLLQLLSERVYQPVEKRREDPSEDNGVGRKEIDRGATGEPKRPSGLRQGVASRLISPFGALGKQPHAAVRNAYARSHLRIETRPVQKRFLTDYALEATTGAARTLGAVWINRNVPELTTETVS